MNSDDMQHFDMHIEPMMREVDKYLADLPIQCRASYLSRLTMHVVERMNEAYTKSREHQHRDGNPYSEGNT